MDSIENSAPPCSTLVLADDFYLVVLVHPMPGPQVGTGRPAVAD